MNDRGSGGYRFAGKPASVAILSKASCRCAVNTAVRGDNFHENQDDTAILAVSDIHEHDVWEVAVGGDLELELRGEFRRRVPRPWLRFR